MRGVGALFGWCCAGLLTCVTLACGGPEVVFAQSQDFGAPGWAYADSVSYAYTITDTSRLYDLVLTVDHAEDFAYQNFYVRLDTYLPDGRHLSQPLSLELADHFGQWYGDCDGGRCRTDISIQEGVRFNLPGEQRLVVTQFSREDPLPAIFGMGYRVIVSAE